MDLKPKERDFPEPWKSLIEREDFVGLKVLATGMLSLPPEEKEKFRAFNGEQAIVAIATTFSIIAEFQLSRLPKGEFYFEFGRLLRVMQDMRELLEEVDKVPGELAEDWAARCVKVLGEASRWPRIDP